MTRSSETARISRLEARFSSQHDERVTVGIGDDAAVLSPPTAPLVCTVDAHVENVHFRAAWISWHDTGWRSLMAATSDVAATGGVPLAILSSLVLPASFSDEVLEAFTEGQAAAARAVGAPVVGGNLARGETFSVTTTVLGQAELPVLRSGAKPGDRLYVSGPVGIAGLGCRALELNSLDDANVALCIESWRRPTAHLAAGLAMASVAHACIDLSDGLATDAWHLARSSGVTLVLDESRLMSQAPSALIAAAQRLGVDPIEAVLNGGEDYVLLCASDRPITGFVDIGAIEPGPAKVVLRGAGKERVVEDAGFDHFRA